MTEIDTAENSQERVSDDEDLMREVIQGDADLFYLHCCLCEIFRAEN